MRSSQIEGRLPLSHITTRNTINGGISLAYAAVRKDSYIWDLQDDRRRQQPRSWQAGSAAYEDTLPVVHDSICWLISPTLPFGAKGDKEGRRKGGIWTTILIVNDPKHKAATSSIIRNNTKTCEPNTGRRAKKFAVRRKGGLDRAPLLSNSTLPSCSPCSRRVRNNIRGYYLSFATGREVAHFTCRKKVL